MQKDGLKMALKTNQYLNKRNLGWVGGSGQFRPKVEILKH